MEVCQLTLNNNNNTLNIPFYKKGHVMRTRLTEEILRQVVYAVVQRHLGSGTPLMPSAI